MAKLNTMAIIVTAINLCLWLAILVGIVALQVFLSRRKAWWPGLVLPALWFAYTAFAVIAAVVGYYQAYGEPLPLSFELVWSALVSLIRANVPTYVLLAAYLFCRSGRRRKKLLDRMQVQDL